MRGLGNIFARLIILFISLNTATATAIETADNQCQNVFFPNCSCVPEDINPSVQCPVSDNTTVQIQFDEDPDKRSTDLRDYSVFTNETYELPKELLKTSNPIKISIMLSGLRSLDSSVCNYQLVYIIVNHVPSLKTIDSKFLHECSALLTLVISNSQIKDVEFTRSKSSCKLQNLLLIDNKIDSVTNDLMQWCTDMVNLDLSGNEISTLSTQFFSSCNSLLTLSLSNNHISELDSQLFTRCDKLEDLDLSNNSIENFEIIDTNTKIRFINLEFNQLHRLPDHVFAPLVNVEEIRLNFNNISFISSKIFDDCARLRIFALKANNLSHFPINVIENCSTIYVLELSDNKLNSLSNHSLPPSLSSLGLSNNKLTSLPSNFVENKNNMNTISLKRNQLITLPANLLTSRYLYRIDLSDNQLKSIPQSAPDSCPSCFDISNNHLTDFDLGANPSVFYNISHNDISVLVAESLNLECVTTVLDASHNELKELKVSIGLQHLLILDLSYNLIEELSSKDLFLLTDLQHFNLSNNKLTYIQDGTFNVMRQLISLNLNGNPIHIYGSHFFPVSIINEENLICPDSAQLIPALKTIMDIQGKNHLCQRLDNCLCQQIKDILINFMCSESANINVLCESGDCPHECHCVSVNSEKFVDCDGANLSTIPAILPVNSSVVYLDNNRLELQSESFSHQSWTFVAYIYMHNSFGSGGNDLIGHPFVNMGQVKKLDLSQNSIVSIKSGFFKGLELLNNLNLSGNLISEFSSELFTDISNLEVLDLSFNKLTNLNLNTSLSEITNLKHLILKNNQISRSYNQQLPASLISLDLKHNVMSSIGFLFQQDKVIPTNLSMVDLSYNNLTEINISTEYLQDNYLKLCLQYNAIEKIHVLNNSNDVKGVLHLLLKKDNLFCDCHLKNLIEGQNSQNNRTNFIIDGGKCHRPVFLKNRNVTSLSPNDLLCAENSECVSGCQCYRNRTTNGTQMDCSESSLVQLPLIAPDQIQSLYINNLSAVQNFFDESWNSLKEFYLTNREQYITDFTALKNLITIQRVEINDDCWCRVRNYISFSLGSIDGTCDQSLPMSHCIRNPEKNDSWSRVECTSAFTPELSYKRVPICPVYEDCGECYCYLDKSLFLVMNCSSKQLTHFPTTKPMGVNILDMSNNSLIVLPDLATRWPKLIELYISNNSIEKITDGAEIPTTLKFVDFDDNSFKTPSGWLNEVMSEKSKVEMKISLMGNPLQCDCERPNFSQWPPSRVSAVLINENLIMCYTENGEGHHLTKMLQCKTSKVALIVAIIMILSILVIMAVILALYFRYRRSIHVYLLAHDLCLCVLKEESFDIGKEFEFDAFLSYSSEDSDVIVNDLLPGLEKLEFKVCVHERDWLGGQFISEQIVNSVQTSRRTIIVLSEAFLRSPWATLEFKVALQQALEDRVNRIIVVVPGDSLPGKDQMDPDLRAFVTMNTYLFLHDSRFWDKLRFAMPHKRKTGKVPLRKLPHDFVQFMKKRPFKRPSNISAVTSESELVTEVDLNDRIEMEEIA